MTCSQVTEILDRYLDDELPTSAQLMLKLHFQGCRDCRNYLSSYKRTIRAAKACLDPDGVPPTVMPEELVKAILAAMTSADGRLHDHDSGTL